MNKRTFKFAALFMSLFVMGIFSSCSDDAPDGIVEEPTEVVEIGNVTEVSLRNSGYGPDNWIYFSLSKHEELTGINESNREGNSTWDIAFYRYNVRTNSGLSGNGNCGAFDTGKKNMKDVTSVPADAVFTIDEMGSITSSMETLPPPSIDAPLNKKLSEAIEFQGPPPTYLPNGHVYIVKTVAGDYVKMQITGFANKKGKSGYLQFRYEYLK